VIEPRPTSGGIAFGFQHGNGNRTNFRSGRQTFTAFAVLHDVASGHSVLMTEMTILTASWTAATSGLSDEVMQAVIGIGGNHKRTQWKPHPPIQKASMEVSEVPCRNDNMLGPIRTTERKGKKHKNLGISTLDMALYIRRIDPPGAVRWIVVLAATPSCPGL
jgi:hypothetical protein